MCLWVFIQFCDIILYIGDYLFCMWWCEDYVRLHNTHLHLLGSNIQQRLGEMNKYSETTVNRNNVQDLRFNQAYSKFRN